MNSRVFSKHSFNRFISRNDLNYVVQVCEAFELLEPKYLKIVKLVAGGSTMRNAANECGFSEGAGHNYVTRALYRAMSKVRSFNQVLDFGGVIESDFGKAHKVKQIEKLIRRRRYLMMELSRVREQLAKLGEEC